MENIENNDYKLSFFKPTTKKALKNRNMALWLIIIWATAVFGFQFLLRIMQEPVPEEAYNNYELVWENVKNENATDEEMSIFANSVLQVLGKVYVKPEYQEALSNAFTWSLFKIAGEDKDELLNNVLSFEKLYEESESIFDEEYIAAKTKLENCVADLLEIPQTDPRRVAIPFSVNSEKIDNYTEENKVITAKVMPMYLIHNRSVLTDTKFLGFPFHYFYTAVFLLTLFIGLCWIYCFITDRRELKEKASN